MIHNLLTTVVTELDAVRYGHVLRARKLVGVRGAGLSAQQIADNEARIFRDEPELSFDDLGNVD